MPVKVDVYAKYAGRMVADLQELHTILVEIEHLATTAGISTRLVSLLDTQKILASRIAIQRDFLRLVAQQCGNLHTENLHFRSQIQTLTHLISIQAARLQLAFEQKCQEIHHVLNTRYHAFYGAKKSLCQNYTSPTQLDISL